MRDYGNCPKKEKVYGNFSQSRTVEIGGKTNKACKNSFGNIKINSELLINSVKM